VSRSYGSVDVHVTSSMVICAVEYVVYGEDKWSNASRRRLEAVVILHSINAEKKKRWICTHCKVELVPVCYREGPPLHVAVTYKGKRVGETVITEPNRLLTLTPIPTPTFAMTDL